MMRFDVPDSFMLLAVVGGIHATDVIDWELGDDMIDRFIMLAGSEALEEAMEIVRIIGDPNLAKLMLPEGGEKITPANTDLVRLGANGQMLGAAVEGRLAIVTHPTVIFRGELSESARRLVESGVVEWESE